MIVYCNVPHYVAEATAREAFHNVSFFAGPPGQLK
jgi:hypothetical protein